MAFQSKDLSMLAYANGFTLWHYTTPDAATSICTAGYFNGASDLLRIGDMVLANTGTICNPTGCVLMVTSANTGSAAVTDLTSFGSVSQQISGAA